MARRAGMAQAASDHGEDRDGDGKRRQVGRRDAVEEARQRPRAGQTGGQAEDDADGDQQHAVADDQQEDVAACRRRAPAGCPSRACAARSRTTARRRCRRPRAAARGRRTRRAATRPCARAYSDVPIGLAHRLHVRAPAGSARAPGSRGGCSAIERRRRDRGAHVQRHAGLVILRERQVRDRQRRPRRAPPYLLSRTTPTISRHGPLGPSKLMRLPIGLSPGKVHARGGLVDDDDQRPRSRRPASRKSRPEHERDAERLEEAGADDVRVDRASGSPVTARPPSLGCTGRASSPRPSTWMLSTRPLPPSTRDARDARRLDARQRARPARRPGGRTRAPARGCSAAG